MRLLLVEDDTGAADHVIEDLRAKGHDVDHTVDGRKGLELAASGGYDVVALDRMLPGMDGLSIVAAMRASNISTPVLFLTNLSGVADRVDGLEAGGDDYLVKPFALEELHARLSALARRPTLGATQTVLRAGDLEMDLVARVVRRGGENIDLAPREFQVLEYLLRAEGRVATRKMLLEQVWNFHFDPQTNIVETHISRLRTKIDQGKRPSLIRNIRNAGYSLRA